MSWIRLLVAYDGSPFSGWQRQPGAVTVQGCLDAAASRMAGGQSLQVAGASRTDAGVHAEAQLAGFEHATRLGPRDWLRGLNALTPPTILVRAAAEAEPDFAPRRVACGKRYRYLLWQGDRLPPTLLGRAWATPRLDLDAMREAAQILVGEHDFAAFRASDCQAPTTVRRIDAIDIAVRAEAPFAQSLAHERAASVAIEVRGNAFLKNMVRILVGSLVAVGLGQQPRSWLAAALASRDRRCAGRTAPADGLCLVEVFTEPPLAW